MIERHESALRNLETVAVLNLSRAPEIGLHTTSLLDNGAVVPSISGNEALRDITQQKIAVIVDQSITNEALEVLITMSDNFIHENPDKSLRIFYFKWTQHTAVKLGSRVRIIDPRKVAAHDLPIHINRSLYKARLPYFLRQGFDIEISPELQHIKGEYYRPITIKKHLKSELDSAAEYSDKTRYIYITSGKKQKLYQVAQEGRLEEKTWNKELKDTHETVEVKNTQGIYSKEYDRFYRIDGDCNLSEVNPEKTRPGKIDYISVGLMIHNKDLFMLDAENCLVQIDENGYIMSQKHGSTTPPALLPMSNYKSSEDEE